MFLPPLRRDGFLLWEDDGGVFSLVNWTGLGGHLGALVALKLQHAVVHGGYGHHGGLLFFLQGNPIGALHHPEAPAIPSTIPFLQQVLKPVLKHAGKVRATQSRKTRRPGIAFSQRNKTVSLGVTTEAR